MRQLNYVVHVFHVHSTITLFRRLVYVNSRSMDSAGQQQLLYSDV